MKKTPRLRVVTVAFNPGGELENFCTTLAEAVSIPYEIVIFDNGSIHDYVDSVAHTHGATVLRTGENLGYGKAINEGARHFDGDWLLIANPDVSFSPDSIDTLLEESERWERGGAFAPRILTPEGEVYPSARAFPRLTIGTGHALLGAFWKTNPFTVRYFGHYSGSQARVVEWLSGACLLVRLSAFQDVGGFDSSYFMFFEDTQLGADLIAHGWKSVYVPRATIVHDQGKSWRDQPAEMIRAHHASAQRFMARLYAAPHYAPVRFAIRAGLNVREKIAVALAEKKK